MPSFYCVLYTKKAPGKVESHHEHITRLLPQTFVMLYVFFKNPIILNAEKKEQDLRRWSPGSEQCDLYILR